jgi:hypothetical protein
VTASASSPTTTPYLQALSSHGIGWVRGETWVPLIEVQRLVKVRTTCRWRGHPFEVGIIVGDSANVTYLGKDFDAVGGLPGMWRPDKFVVQGTVPVSELTDVEQHFEEIP